MGKILITDYEYRGKTRRLAFLSEGNRLLKVKVCSDSILGNIYKGKVISVSKPMNACFVDIGDGQKCFMPMPEGQTLKPGDEPVVMVKREAIDDKLPSVTADITLTGFFFVLALGDKGIKYSSKLSAEEKSMAEESLNNLEWYKEYVTSDKAFGLIIRNNIKNATDFDIVGEEFKALSKQLLDIVKHSDSRTCFSLFYEEKPEYITFIRDSYLEEYDEIVTDVQEIYDELVNANLPAPIRLYTDSMLSLSNLYSLQKGLDEALDRKVWLKSGGWIEIQSTEAMTVIDVNSGKYSEKNKSHDDMIKKINLEACDEIARQLVLRNLSGIIVCDFINMNKVAGGDLLDYLKDAVKNDQVKTTVVDITKLGLVELTRTKTGKPLRQQII